jgi:hypothetical protein
VKADRAAELVGKGGPQEGAAEEVRICRIYRNKYIINI